MDLNPRCEQEKKFDNKNTPTNINSQITSNLRQFKLISQSTRMYPPSKMCKTPDAFNIHCRALKFGQYIQSFYVRSVHVCARI